MMPTVRKPQVDTDVTEPEREDDGTVWIGRFHVEVGSAAYESLIARGETPGPPPKEAGE